MLGGTKGDYARPEKCRDNRPLLGLFGRQRAASKNFIGGQPAVVDVDRIEEAAVCSNEVQLIDLTAV